MFKSEWALESLTKIQMMADDFFNISAEGFLNTPKIAAFQKLTS